MANITFTNTAYGVRMDVNGALFQIIPYGAVTRVSDASKDFVSILSSAEELLCNVDYKDVTSPATGSAQALALALAPMLFSTAAPSPSNPLVFPGGPVVLSFDEAAAAGLYGSQINASSVAGRVIGGTNTAREVMFSLLPTTPNTQWSSPQTVASTLSIVSTSNNDGPAGGGAQQVDIGGVDNNWDELYESIPLNGNTPVVTTNAFLRVNFVQISYAGPSKTNEGNIILRDTSTTNVVGGIAAGDSSSFYGMYAIPNGKGLFVKGGIFSATDNVEMMIALRYGGFGDTTWRFVSPNGGQDLSLSFPSMVTNIIPAGIEFGITTRSAGGTGTYNAFANIQAWVINL